MFCRLSLYLKLLSQIFFVTLATILDSLATPTRKRQLPNNHLQSKEKDLQERPKGYLQTLGQLSGFKTDPDPSLKANW